MKRLTLMIILAVLVCLICGCEAKDPDRTTTPITTAAPTETTPILQTEPVTKPATEPTVPIDENISFFTELLTPYYNDKAESTRNYYNMAMCCQFSCPEELPLATFFVNGFYGVEVTKEEQEFVSDFYEAKRLEPDMMNEVLQEYFDITLDDINWDVVGIRYWEKTGCYYTLGNDVLENTEFTITNVEALENGIFKIHYDSFYPSGKFVITLQSRESEGGEGFRILSNILLPPPGTTTPIEPTEPMDSNALSTEEIEALEAVYTTHESLTFCFPRNWYNATLGQEFDSPEDLNVNRFFTHPGAVIPLENYELTDAEIDFLMTFQHMHGIFQTETDVYRLPKADAEFLLKWYFDLELENADMTEVYWEETDCYYFASEPGGVLAFEVLEAEYIDDDLIWFRYRDARSHSRPEYEAVIRVYRERFVILSNKVAE